MRFLFVINSLGRGGAEKQVLLLAYAMAKLGWSGEVITFEKRETNLEIEDLIVRCQALGIKISQPPFRLFRRTILYARILLRYYFSKMDLVWLWGAKIEAVAKVLLLRKDGTTIFSSLRSAGRDVVAKRSSIYRFRQGLIDAYISNSHLNIAIFKEFVTFLEKKSSHGPRFFVLNNCLGLETNPPAFKSESVRCDHDAVQETVDSEQDRGIKNGEHGLRIGVLGNNRFYIKGYDLLIEVAKKIKRSGRAIKISLAGKDYEGDLSDKIAQNDVADVISYIGEVDDSKGFLLKQDLFLLTSRVEGMPNSLIEAMSLGIPSISTKVGDLDRLFGAVDALRLCEIEDIDSIFDSICWCQDHRDKAFAMGARGKESVHSQMSFLSIQEKLGDILEEFGLRT
ncbi:MAG: glycosyltransferase [Pirellula sp.]|jgi:glycosyltransferase involved in cell wall biosynthesis